MSVQEIYESAIRRLPAMDRLKLASLILDDLTTSQDLDLSHDWNDQDIADLTAATLKHAGESMPLGDNDA